MKQKREILILNEGQTANTISEEEFIGLATNPKKGVRQRIHTKDGKEIYVVFDRDYIFDRRQDLVEKYKLLIDENVKVKNEDDEEEEEFF